MTILIPVDSKNRDECIISSIEENNAWAFVTLDEGRVEKIEFFDRREDISCWIDAVVVINALEYVWPFLLAMVRSTSNCRSIESLRTM